MSVYSKYLQSDRISTKDPLIFLITILLSLCPVTSPVATNNNITFISYSGNSRYMLPQWQSFPVAAPEVRTKLECIVVTDSFHNHLSHIRSTPIQGGYKLYHYDWNSVLYPDAARLCSERQHTVLSDTYMLPFPYVYITRLAVVPLPSSYRCIESPHIRTYTTTILFSGTMMWQTPK